ncbi:MAG TPA: efflux RND transporter permease subunit, partial [Polyangiales bacterium]|nr:efflux RND transporter permease subunit [Polyangiales bacterium]
FYGPDLTQLSALGERAATAVRAIPGAVDVRVEQVAGLRYLRVIPDRAKLARYGFTIDDVNQLTETLAVGHAAGEVLEGERRFGITIKLDHHFEGELGPLLALPLRSLSGQMVPLGDVARLEFVTGPAQVSRDAQSRRISVEFNVRGRDLTSTIAEAQQRVALKLPNGYYARWGGQFEHYQEARARLAFVVPLALLAILFLLWLALGSWRAALLIFSAVPFAFVGGVVALWVRAIPFSISAGVGFIALFGVAVLNGLVLVSFANERERQGLDRVSAIEEACALRVRPVLMTALVAALGFIPMALSSAPGSEIQRPLATVVIGGLLSATLLTMLVLPVLYAWFTSPLPASAGRSLPPS